MVKANMNVTLRFVFAVHGCCKDGAMPASGPNYKGCPGESALFFFKDIPRLYRGQF